MSHTSQRTTNKQKNEQAIQQRKKELSLLRRTLLQTELAVDQVRKAIEDVERRLKTMEESL